MTEKMKDETTNEIRELTQDEIAAVSGGNLVKIYMPAPLSGTETLEAPPTGHSQTTITSGGERIGGSSPIRR